MSLITFTTSVSLAILALPALYATPRCPGNVASLTLRPVQGSLIIVPVEINHSGPYDFLVDTGAQITTIDSSLAVNLGAKAQGAAGVSGVATYARYAFANLDLLQAGTHIIPNALVVIQDLKQLKEADPRIRGILGDNFLEHFDVLSTIAFTFCASMTSMPLHWQSCPSMSRSSNRAVPSTICHSLDR
jgi:Aspartyl protease